MRSTIKPKPGITFAIVVTMLIAIVAIGVSHMARIHATIGEVIDGPAKRQARLLPVQVAADDILRLDTTMARSRNPTQVRQVDPRNVGGDASGAANNVATGNQDRAPGFAPGLTHGGPASDDAFGRTS